ncbi:MAG TPA: glycosyltransferase family 2 protein [Chromatiaceae bacterium]|nr:glycosyltransferase family 2 protein [Chromatiaceae bacterium]
MACAAALAHCERSEEGRVRLIVSLVTHEPELAELARTLDSLGAALRRVPDWDRRVLLVLNGSERVAAIAGLARAAGLDRDGIRLTLDKPGQNLGFGRAHNRVLRLLGTPRDADRLLILNPDVVQHETAIANALQHLRDHPESVAVSPRAAYEDGTRQYLCKRYPSLLDFALRGFAPAPLRRLFATRLAHYEMRGETEERVVAGVELISGCWLLCRATAFAALGGFDAGYFLYFEDYDLSLRLRRLGRLDYLPDARIVHLGGHAARKGWRHRWLFLRSARRFFASHGWRLA